MGFADLFKKKETDDQKFDKYLKRETAIAKAARRASGVSPIAELKAQMTDINEMRGMFNDMEADRQEEILNMLEEKQENPEDALMKSVLPLLLGGKPPQNPPLNQQIGAPQVVLPELSEADITMIDKHVLAKIPKAGKVLFKSISPAKQESALLYILNKLRA